MKIVNFASLLLAAVLATFAQLDAVSAGLLCGNATPVDTSASGSTAASDAASACSASSSASAKLPVFYFHGSNGNAANSANYRANLTAEGRTFVTLDFCSDACSTSTGLATQAQLGLAQVREVIANNSALFEDGYIFMAHSQGGSVAKFVIEEMDEHKVKTFVSLAASANGRFYGPQEGDDVALNGFMSFFASQVPTYVLNVSEYAANTSTWRGQFQRDLLQAELSYPELQASIPLFNQLRSPYEAPWIEVNPVFPVYNNLLDCSTLGDAAAECLANQTRYKDNFMRVENVHLFASPNDSVQAPYQTGLYGAYSTVDSFESIADDFESLQVLDMIETREYLEDSYGLQTMHTNGQIHRYLVPDVSHNCWNADVTAFGFTCEWQPLYDEYIYPLL
jgi:palmitoyl-protein thioesterase